jgi:hypothetical protein
VDKTLKELGLYELAYSISFMKDKIKDLKQDEKIDWLLMEQSSLLSFVQIEGLMDKFIQYRKDIEVKLSMLKEE